MPAAKERDQELLDHLILADDHAGQLALDLIKGALEPANRLQIALSQWFGGFDACDVCLVGHASFISGLRTRGSANRR